MMLHEELSDTQTQLQNERLVWAQGTMLAKRSAAASLGEPSRKRVRELVMIDD
jgi:hypothetical protein